MANISHGVPVLTPAFAGSKLYCLLTDAHECEQLAKPQMGCVIWKDVFFVIVLFILAFQYFNTVYWVTRRASGYKKNLVHKSQKFCFQETWLHMV